MQTFLDTEVLCFFSSLKIVFESAGFAVQDGEILFLSAARFLQLPSFLFKNM
jgi:hypothetical protein